MIKQELRIGSLVMYENTTHIIRELGTNSVSHNWLGSPNEVPYISGYEDISGIPITPDVLEKCGFDKEKIASFNQNHISRETYLQKKSGFDWRMRLYLDNETCYWMVNYSKSVEVRYLHELQNLVFSLSGEELNYTP